MQGRTPRVIFGEIQEINWGSNDDWGRDGRDSVCTFAENNDWSLEEMWPMK